MPTTRGKIGDKVVSVLRDTGCSGVVVKRELVPAGKMTGKSRDCYLADGSIIQVPLAVVDIDTPYYTGEVEAWCLTNPLFDLILFNIQNVRVLWDLHMFYLLRPVLFRARRYFTGLCSSNIPQYFLDFASCQVSLFSI